MEGSLQEWDLREAESAMLACRVPDAAFLSFGDSSDADWLFSFARAAGPTASLELPADQGDAETVSASPAARAPLPAADATTSAELGTGSTADSDTGAASLSDPAAEEPVMSEMALEPPAESQAVHSAPEASVPEMAAAPELGAGVLEPAPKGVRAEDAANPAITAAAEPGTRASAEVEDAARASGAGDVDGPTTTEPEAQREAGMLHPQHLSVAVETDPAAPAAHQAAGADMSTLSAPGERPGSETSSQCGSASSQGDLIMEVLQLRLSKSNRCAAMSRSQ